MTPRRRTLFRLLLVAAGMALPLLAGEVALRLKSPTLPSLSALDEVDEREVGEFMRWTDPRTQPPGCRAAEGEHRLYYRPRKSTVAPPPDSPPARPLELWVVGDSVVAGWGVTAGSAWPHGLARGLAADRAQPVDLTLVGGAGLGHCELLLDTHRLLETASPDALVFQVFADDLVYRKMVQVRGRIAARPDGMRGPWGWLARHSWLANRLWFSWVSRLGGAAPARELDAGGRARFEAALQGLAERLAEVDAATLFVLVPPAGIERCGADEAWSDCDWLRHDLGWLATALDESGLPWLDLRSIWSEHDPHTLSDEEVGWVERKHLPVHPGEAGHASLAEAVLPALEARLRPTPASTP